MLILTASLSTISLSSRVARAFILFSNWLITCFESYFSSLIGFFISVAAALPKKVSRARSA